MTDDSQARALSRLQDPEAGHVDALAALVVQEAFDTSLDAVVDPAALASLGCAVVAQATANPTLRRTWAEQLEAARTRARSEPATPRELLPPDAEAPVRALLEVPWLPSEPLVIQLLDHQAVRTLLKEVLGSALTRFGQGARKSAGGALGGRARGLFRDLESAAGGLVDAVRGEVEAALQGRVKAFLSTAVDEAIHGIARWVADPRHADTGIQLRLSILDLLLDTPIQTLAAEADELDAATLVDAVAEAVHTLATRDDVVRATEDALREGLARFGDQTLGTALEEAELADTLRAPLQALLAARLRDVVTRPAFAAWWAELHA